MRTCKAFTSRNITVWPFCCWEINALLAPQSRLAFFFKALITAECWYVEVYLGPINIHSMHQHRVCRYMRYARQWEKWHDISGHCRLERVPDIEERTIGEEEEFRVASTGFTENIEIDPRDNTWIPIPPIWYTSKSSCWFTFCSFWNSAIRDRERARFSVQRKLLLGVRWVCWPKLYLIYQSDSLWHFPKLATRNIGNKRSFNWTRRSSQVPQSTSYCQLGSLAGVEMGLLAKSFHQP